MEFLFHIQYAEILSGRKKRIFSIEIPLSLKMDALLHLRIAQIGPQSASCHSETMGNKRTEVTPSNKHSREKVGTGQPVSQLMVLMFHVFWHQLKINHLNATHLNLIGRKNSQVVWLYMHLFKFALFRNVYLQLLRNMYLQLFRNMNQDFNQKSASVSPPVVPPPRICIINPFPISQSG